jgi:hypothetical protein
VKRAARFLAGVLLWGTSTGCYRQLLVHEFSDPELRLRSPLHPTTVSDQPKGGGGPYAFTINVYAPWDSAVVLVLRSDVPIDDLEPVIGDAGTQHVKDAMLPVVISHAPPVVTVFEERGKTQISSAIRATRISYLRPQLWASRVFHEDRRSRPIDQAERFLVVRPGEVARLFVSADIVPNAKGKRDERVRVMFRWLTVPAEPAEVTTCGQHPVLLSSDWGLPPRLACGALAGHGTMPRSVDAAARIVRINYLTVGFLGAAFTSFIWAISAS